MNRNSLRIDNALNGLLVAALAGFVVFAGADSLRDDVASARAERLQARAASAHQPLVALAQPAHRDAAAR